jgi:hypothetical protein
MKTVITLILKILVLVAVLPFLAWNMCFGFVSGYILFGVLLAAIIILKKKSLRFILFIVGISAMGYLVMLPLTLFQYQDRAQKIFRKIQRGEDLQINEKLSIYGLNLSIGIVAFPVYPEVAKETLLMCIPSRENKRTFKSDFFLESGKIQEANANKRNRVSWSKNEFVMGNKESRYALALNPCTLRVTEREDYAEYEVTVNVEYARNFPVVLIGWPLKITLQEGLFWYLQEINWLHPYKASWICRKPDISHNFQK